MRTTISHVALSLGALLGFAMGPLGAQQAPKDLKATPVSPTKVNLSWTRGTNAVGHRVLRGVGGAHPIQIGYVQSPGAAYADANAPAGSRLLYQIMAKYPNSPNKYTPKVSVTTPSAGSTASSTPPPSSSPPAATPATPAAPSSVAAVPSSPVLTAVPLATTSTAVLQRSPTSAVPAGRLAPAVAAPPAPAPAPPAPAAPMPVSGRYRVVANGFTVIHESFDDQLSRDGKYDEVYGGFTMLHYDRKTGDVLDRDLRRTKVLGDIQNFPDRLRAGSASGSGGLRAGDSYPDAGHARYRGGVEPNSQTFPFKVWEGTLTDGADAAVILPTMWEQDSDGSTYDAWHQAEVSSASQIWFDGAVQQALKQTSLGVIAPPGSITPNMTPTFGKDALAATGFFAALGQPWVGALFAGSRDRPIGMVPGPVSAVGAALPRRAIVLTREIIEHSLNGSRILPDPASLGPGNAWMLAYFDVPVGVIPVLLRDGPGQNLQANYVMYLQVERM